MDVSRIIKKLPADSTRHAVREITVLTNSVFGRTHLEMIPKEFGVKFSMTFWRKVGNQTYFYRSWQEYDNFACQMRDLCLAKKDYAHQISEKLIKSTDGLLDFIKRNGSLDRLVKHNKELFDLYRDYFGYHQAVYWSSNYLAEMKNPSKKVLAMISKLDKAYKYNEVAIPQVDNYFKKFKIDHLLQEEINENVKENIRCKPRQRSLLFLGKDMLILADKEASIIEKKIIRLEDEQTKFNQRLKGTAAGGGVYRGRVKVIDDLNKLGECQPGDILVTMMTRPQFNTAIKKVGAIVTNEGGALCHASLLAREFNIPCVVGTRIATQILDNDDLVEVDGDQGTVKIIQS